MKSRSLIRLFASIALLMLVLWFIGPQQVMASCARADPAWLLGGLIASLIANLLSALRWRALADWFDIDITVIESVVVYFRGVTANTLLPGATLSGDALRALHLQSSGHALAHAATSVVLDRLSGLWILITLSITTIGVALLTGAMSGKLFPTTGYAALMLALLCLVSPIAIWFSSIQLARLLPQRAASLLAALHARPQPIRLFLSQIFRSGSVQFFSIAAFACGGHAVGLDLPWWQYAIAAGPVFLFASIPVGVGGWGTREAAAAVVLGSFGAARELAVATAILYGVFATLQGLLGALSLLKLDKR